MKDMKLPVANLLLVCLFSLLSGCGKRPFLIVQVCLGDQQNVAVFKNMMKSIARSEHMEYSDASVTTQKQLTVIKSNPNYSVINLDVDGEDGVGLGAINVGLSAYEVAIGFAQGTNPKEAQRFADTVVAALKTKWYVYTVPPGQGALPLAACQKTLK